jgi:hypothetical protein
MNQVKRGVANSVRYRPPMKSVEQKRLDIFSAAIRMCSSRQEIIDQGGVSKRYANIVLSYRIFGFEGDHASDIMYNNWLSQIRAGLLALEYYSVDSRKWGQVNSVY